MGSNDSLNQDSSLKTGTTFAFLEKFRLQYIYIYIYIYIYVCIFSVDRGIEIDLLIIIVGMLFESVLLLFFHLPCWFVTDFWIFSKYDGLFVLLDFFK